MAKLLAHAHSSGIVAVGKFLEHVSGLRDTGAPEGEARAITEGAIQIMTVHAGKAMEFTVVALAMSPAPLREAIGVDRSRARCVASCEG